MSFVKKTPAEFEALSEYQKEKYLDDKAKFEAEQQENLIREAAEKIVNEKMKEEREKAEKEGKDALENFKKEAQKEVEDLLTQLNRAKEAQFKEVNKDFSESIIEKLSTEEGEKMIKDFFEGHKSALKVELDGDNYAKTFKAMPVVAGSVAPHISPIVGPGHDDYHARNAIRVVPTVTNLVKFLQYVVDTNAAGFGMVAVGGQKPTINYIGTVKEAPVRKIAGLLDVPDELVDDVVGFRAWIAYELPKALLDYEDFQIFKGDGTGENLLGLWYQASPQTFPMGTVTVNSNHIDQIMAGITEVRQLKRATSAVFVSPVEWMEILINKDLELAYTYPIVLDANGVMRIGNIPILWSNAFDEGEGLVGDFAQGATIWQRKEMSIAYFDQNKDNVEKNVITIRLEERLALSINYPESFKRLFATTT